MDESNRSDGAAAAPPPRVWAWQTDVCVGLGVAAVSAGAALFHLGAGLIVFGVALVLIGVAAARPGA